MNPIQAQTDSAKRQQLYEQKLAACAFMAGPYVRQACAWVRPEDFVSDPRLVRFWREFITSGDAGKAAVDASLYNDLQAWTQNVEGPFVDALTFARKMASQAWLTEQAKHATAILRAVSAGDSDAALATIRAMHEGRPASTEAGVWTATDAQARFAELVRTGMRAVPYGLPPLDRIMGGIERQCLTIVAARPGMGKSALALQIARHNAAQGKRVLFVSLEMKVVSLWARMACGDVLLPWRLFKGGRATEQQKRMVTAKGEELRQQYHDSLIIYDKTASTDEVWQIAAAHMPDLLVVDHMGLLTDKGDNEVLRLGQISWRLRTIAEELDIPALVLCQLNRGVESRDNKRPMLSDLRQSGEIEQNADVVLALYRPDYYGANTAVRQIIVPLEVLVLKHRDGENKVYGDFSYHLEKQQIYETEKRLG